MTVHYDQPKNMKLPVGKSCSDCMFYKTKCTWLLSRVGDEQVCDWSPSKYQETGADIKKLKLINMIQNKHEHNFAWVVQKLKEAGLYARCRNDVYSGSYIIGGSNEITDLEDPTSIMVIENAFFIRKHDSIYRVEYTWPGQIGHIEECASLEWLVGVIPNRVSEWILSRSKVNT